MILLSQINMLVLLYTFHTNSCHFGPSGMCFIQADGQTIDPEINTWKWESNKCIMRLVLKYRIGT